MQIPVSPISGSLQLAQCLFIVNASDDHSRIQQQLHSDLVDIQSRIYRYSEDERVLKVFTDSIDAVLEFLES